MSGKPVIAKFRSELSAMSPEFSTALPSHIRPEKFQRVVLTAVQTNPVLLDADRRSLFESCMKCASDGLMPDGREAALTIFKSKVKVPNGPDQWIDKVQYIPMFTGIQKRVRNSGLIDSIQAHVIYEHDHFIWRQGFDERIEHTPLFPGDRGHAIGAYAVAKFKDGSVQFEVMDLATLTKVKNASKSSKFGPWVDWWDEMARKTVFKRLAKWLPLDADVDDLIEYDNKADRVEDEPIAAIENEPVAAIAHKRSKLDDLIADAPATEEPAPEVIPEDVAHTDDF